MSVGATGLPGFSQDQISLLEAMRSDVGIVSALYKALTGFCSECRPISTFFQRFQFDSQFSVIDL